MKIFNETEIKYLAGLLDADGSLSIAQGTPNSIRLSLELPASEGTDRHGFIMSLGTKLGGVSTTQVIGNKPINKWKVGARTELNLLLPRLLKHMVIKAGKWKVLYDYYCDNKGRVDESVVNNLPSLRILADTKLGPLKPKNHPTWAWIAGYLDGDGFYSFKRVSTPNPIMFMGACSKLEENQGILLLLKAFGGTLREETLDSGQIICRWRHNLGISVTCFSKMFLTKVVKHSYLKKYKIEQMLNFHNNYSQRLSELNPTG